MQPKSRAHYRTATGPGLHKARERSRKGSGRRKVDGAAGLEMVTVTDGTQDRRCAVGFELARCRVFEGEQGPLLLNVFRSGHLVSDSAAQLRRATPPRNSAAQATSRRNAP